MKSAILEPARHPAKAISFVDAELQPNARARRIAIQRGVQHGEPADQRRPAIRTKRALGELGQFQEEKCEVGLDVDRTSVIPPYRSVQLDRPIRPMPSAMSEAIARRRASGSFASIASSAMRC